MKSTTDAIDLYYKNQAKVRGIDTLAAAEALAGRIDRIYDALVLPLLPASKSARIYEVACGPGMTLAWLKRRGYANARGTDICSDYIGVAQDAGLLAEVRDSLADLKATESSVLDVIFAIDFIEHLPKDTFVDFMYDALRVLKPGGVLVLRVPNGDSPLVGRNLFNDITHFWAYTTVSLRAITQIIGYSTVSFRDEAEAPPPRTYVVLPVAVKMARRCMTLWWRLISRERIDYWGPNLFVFARK